MEDLGGRFSVRRVVYRGVFNAVVDDLRRLHRNGVPMMPGTDVGVALMYPGTTLHDELWYFVRDIGMTPMEALESATRVPAAWFGLRDSLGTIEPGQLADLVLLAANPLDDIRNTRRVVGVIRNGRYHDRASLDSLAASAATSAVGAQRRTRPPAR